MSIRGKDSVKLSNEGESKEFVSQEFREKMKCKWANLVESRLFTTSSFVSLSEISKDLPEIPKDLIKRTVYCLQKRYDDINGALEIYVLEECSSFKFKLRIKTSIAKKKSIKKFTWGQRFKPLTLKTLAFIAYNQPIEKEDVVAVMGKTSLSRIKILEKHKFLRANDISYSALNENDKEIEIKTTEYETTQYFADHLGIPNRVEFIRSKLSEYLN